MLLTESEFIAEIRKQMPEWWDLGAVVSPEGTGSIETQVDLGCGLGVVRVEYHDGRYTNEGWILNDGQFYPTLQAAVVADMPRPEIYAKFNELVTLVAPEPLYSLPEVESPWRLNLKIHKGNRYVGRVTVEYARRYGSDSWSVTAKTAKGSASESGISDPTPVVRVMIAAVMKASE